MPVWHHDCHASEAIFTGRRASGAISARQKEAPTEAESDDSGDEGGRSCTDGLDALWPEGTQGKEHTALQGKFKMQELGGVRGRYLVGASHQPQEHAIAAAMCRIIIWGVVNAIPLRILEGLKAQMAFCQH